MASMDVLRHIGMGIALLMLGWLGGELWHQVIVSTFQSTGAKLIVTHPEAGALDLLVFALLTGAVSLLAVAIRALLVSVTGRSLWPDWGLALALLLGENLAVMLRIVALATLTLPQAVGIAASQNTTPTLDISTATISPWAFGGILGSAVLIIGMLTAMGLLSQEDEP